VALFVYYVSDLHYIYQCIQQCVLSTLKIRIIDLNVKDIRAVETHSMVRSLEKQARTDMQSGLYPAVFFLSKYSNLF
jgi:hypothetical protein